jgi:thiol-disulfide isomerase/thioredoxin
MTGKSATGAQSKKSYATLWWVLGGALGLALIVLLAISIASEGTLDTSAGYGSPVVTGNALPVYNADAAADVATGLIAPTVEGADWNGNPISIAPDGKPKIVVFLAHWCPHCQAEVPVIQAWVNAGNLPSDIELVSVATLTNPANPNWPPQDWLEREGWTAPVIMDNASDTVSGNYGLSGTPFWVVLNGDNNVLQRAAGEITVDGLATLVSIAEAGNPG